MRASPASSKDVCAPRSSGGGGERRPAAAPPAALVSAFAPADPRKIGAGKLEIPRGADGKPLKWIEGMATCRCGTARGQRHGGVRA